MENPWLQAQMEQEMPFFPHHKINLDAVYLFSLLPTFENEALKWHV